MQAHRYPQMLDMIERGLLQPEKLIGQHINLDQAPAALCSMNDFRETGVTVIQPFGLIPTDAVPDFAPDTR
jgi:alcohol dehydrogenase